MRRRNDFEDLLQGVFAIIVFIIMGALLSPLLFASLGGPAIFIIIFFYVAILLIAVALILKFLEMIGVKF